MSGQETVRSREWWLRRHVMGRPTTDDVELVEVEVGEPETGWVRVANEAMSVEPYMRGRMSGMVTYAQPYELDRPMRASAVGIVTASASPGVAVGDRVRHDYGWREHALVPANECEVLPADDMPASWYLGVLGIPGMTAWVGLRRIARLRADDVVYVSSAAGAVGSTAVSLAKATGCRVIGSAGSPEKVAALREELGADAAFDHHDGPLSRSLGACLAEIGAKTLDVYYDNVGGDHLEAAIRHLGPHARVVLCGMISMYNNVEKVPGPGNLIRLVWSRSRMEGFIVNDHADAAPQFHAEVVGLIGSGRLTPLETRVAGGVAHAFEGFLGLLDGAGIGKVVVPLGPSHWTIPDKH